MNQRMKEQTNGWPNEQIDGQASKHAKWTVRINEWGVSLHFVTYRLTWVRRTWRWWDEWDDTALRTQDQKFEPCWGHFRTWDYWDVPLDRVPFGASSFGTGCLFWASGIGTGSFFELSTLGTRLACIFWFFRLLSAEFHHIFQPNSLKML